MSAGARDHRQEDTAYRAQTNGKAERFIRTLLERWAYAYSYQHEAERLGALRPALDVSHRQPRGTYN